MTERDIFYEAQEIADLPSRQAYLNQACGGDEALKHRIEDLLEMHVQMGNFLESPPGPGGLPTVALSAVPPAVIGPYKLLQQIGEGGMGTVFMAEQILPVQRRVAIKIIKPGMDSRRVIARFEAERQALALMDHPNIAKVLDAGTIGEKDDGAEVGDERKTDIPSDSSLIPHLSALPSGRPYFVMELVKGVPITRYCDERRLTPRERLKLFLPVCQAVQHAHQKGIIHRDLKPSNVLVAEYDDRPVPKVIDFGVAKAIGRRLTERTMFTEFGQLIGTLEYMSPEQAKLNALDIDTRSDIYVLGVLLYELLTATTPLEEKRIKQTPFDEMLRIVREEEPTTPSNRLRTTVELPAIAANRGLEPGKLSSLVKGDLDWIVMKCLEKDRNRRYDSAAALALDLERYLDDEPVQASPPSAWSRGRRFARRNRMALAIAGVTLFFLVVVGGGVGWIMRDRAIRSAIQENEVTRALEEARYFYEHDRQPEAIATVERAAAILEPGHAHEELRARVQQWRKDLELVGRLDEIRLEESAVRNEHFDTATAAPAYRDAFRQYGLDLEVLDAQTAAERIRASAIKPHLIAALEDWTFLRPRAERPGMADLLAIARLADPDLWRDRLRNALEHRDSKSLEALGRDLEVEGLPPATLVCLAKALASLDRAPLAVQVLRRAQRRYSGDFWINHELGYHLRRSKSAQAAGFYRAALALRPGNPGVHVNLGMALREQGDPVEAEAEFRAAVRIQPGYASAHNNLGIALTDQGRLDEAVAQYREAIRLNPNLELAHSNLGGALHRQGRFDEAIAACERALHLQPKCASAHNNLGSALQSKQRLDEAAAEFREAIRLDPNAAVGYTNLGIVLFEQGRLDEAIAAHKKALQLVPENARAHNDLGAALRRRGRIDEAIAEYKEALRLKPEYVLAHFNLGAALRDKGRLDEAIDEFKEALRLQPGYAKAHTNLGIVFSRQGRLDLALAEHKQAVRLQPQYAEAHLNVGVVLSRQGRLDEAIAEIQEAIRRKPEFPDAHYNLGTAFQHQGRLEEAIAQFREAIRLQPNLAEAHANLGTALKDQGELEEAAACYREAIRYGAALIQAPALARVRKYLGDIEKALKPQDAPGHCKLAEHLLRRNRLDRAESEVRTAIRMEPNCAVAHCLLGEILYRQGKSADGEAAIQHALQLKPDDLRLLGGVGNEYAELGQWDKARAALARVLELAPDNAAARHMLAIAHLGAGDRDAYRKVCWLILERHGTTKEAAVAEEVVNACTSVPDTVADPGQLLSLAELGGPNKLRALGASLYRAGKYQEVIQRLEESARLKPPQGWDWFFLAMAHHQLGHDQQAAACLQHGIAASDQARNRPWDRKVKERLLRLEAETLLQPKTPAP
jgi:tetratricopeptide (TPR) repeat protein